MGIHGEGLDSAVGRLLGAWVNVAARALSEGFRSGWVILRSNIRGLRGGCVQVKIDGEAVGGSLM